MLENSIIDDVIKRVNKCTSQYGEEFISKFIKIDISNTEVEDLKYLYKNTISYIYTFMTWKDKEAKQKQYGVNVHRVNRFILQTLI